MSLRQTNSAFVVDSAIYIFQRIGLKLIEVSAGPALFCLVAYYFFEHFILDQLFKTSAPDDIKRQIFEFSTKILLSICVAYPVYLIGSSLIVTSCTKLARDFILGNVSDINEIKESAIRKLPKVIAVSFLKGTLTRTVFLASIALIAGGVLFQNDFSDVAEGFGFIGIFVWFILLLSIQVSYCLAPTIAAVEEEKIVASIRKSRKYMKNRQGVAQNVAAAWILLTIAIMTLISLPVSIFDLQPKIQQVFPGEWMKFIVTQVFQFLPIYCAIVIGTAFWSVCMTIQYYSVRTIDEALDITLLAEEAMKSTKGALFKI